MKPRIRLTLRCVLVAHVMALLVGPAMAHVVFAEPKARSGAYYAGFFRITHGCGDSGTVSVRISIPDGVVTARPQPKPGWTIRIERAPLAAPLKGEGGTLIRDRVTAITWSGRLRADYFDQFGVMMKLPEAAGPLYFPTVQTCEKGENRWVAIPAAGQAWHSLPFPAPVIELIAPNAMEGMHH